MALTLLTAVQRVCRKVGLDPTITAFSETDETKDIAEDVAETYEDLVHALPKGTPFLDSSGSITTINGTRLYNLASDAMSFDVYDYSLVDQTNSYARLMWVTKDYIQAEDTKYDVSTGKPIYLYADGSQLAVYPVPDAAYTITYNYAKSITTRPSATTDVFVIPDRWVSCVVKGAIEKYERRKGFGDPDKTQMEYVDLLAEVMAEAWESSPDYFYGGDL